MAIEMRSHEFSPYLTTKFINFLSASKFQAFFIFFNFFF